MKISLISFYSDMLIVDPSYDYDAVFLIDVYRATSTMVVITNRGAKVIKPVASLKEAFLIQKRDPSILLCGERNSVKPAGFDYGNDTAQLNKINFNNKTCVLTTSNGTRALYAFANTSGNFFACSLLNLQACIENIQQSQYENILVLCAGNWGEMSVEDYLCATFLINAIEDIIENMNDTIRLAVDTGGFYKENPKKFYNLLKKTDHAQNLKAQDKFEDVCFIVENMNRFDCIPRMQLESTV